MIQLFALSLTHSVAIYNTSRLPSPTETPLRSLFTHSLRLRLRLRPSVRPITSRKFYCRPNLLCNAYLLPLTSARIHLADLRPHTIGIHMQHQMRHSLSLQKKPPIWVCIYLRDFIFYNIGNKHATFIALRVYYSRYRPKSLSLQRVRIFKLLCFWSKCFFLYWITGCN